MQISLNLAGTTLVGEGWNFVPKHKITKISMKFRLPRSCLEQRRPTLEWDLCQSTKSTEISTKDRQGVAWNNAGQQGAEICAKAQNPQKSARKIVRELPGTTQGNKWRGFVPKHKTHRNQHEIQNFQGVAWNNAPQQVAGICDKTQSPQKSARNSDNQGVGWNSAEQQKVHAMDDVRQELAVCPDLR
jgi:hypothetical protein